jgi:hypothetical protein
LGGYSSRPTNKGNKMSNLDVASYVRQGKAFFACNQVNKATTALSTTATGLILYNPWGSTKKLIIYDARFSFSAAATAVGAVMLSTGNTPSVAATPSGTADVIWGADGSGVSTVSVARVFTIATLPIVNVYVLPLVSVAAATLTTTSGANLPEGGFVVGQGNYAMFSHITTVATGIGSFMWVEVPA